MTIVLLKMNNEHFVICIIIQFERNAANRKEAELSVKFNVCALLLR